MTRFGFERHIPDLGLVTSYAEDTLVTLQEGEFQLCQDDRPAAPNSVSGSISPSGPLGENA